MSWLRQRATRVSLPSTRRAGRCAAARAALTRDTTSRSEAGTIGVGVPRRDLAGQREEGGEGQRERWKCGTAAGEPEDGPAGRSR